MLPVDETTRSNITPAYSDAAQARQQPSAPASNPDPAEAAKHVLDTGSRWGRDDYDARTVALADELGKGDPLYREQVMAEIFKQDPNAANSWLTPERVNTMQRDGRISLEQKGVIAEGFASAYNNGHIPQNQIGVGPTPGTGEPGEVQFSDLDQVVSGYYQNAGLGPGYDQVENAKRVSEFLDFVNSSNGPEVAEFRATYGQHLIDQYVLNPAVGYNNAPQRDAAAGLAANLLGGDINRPNIASDVLSKYSSDQVKSIMQAAANSNGLYGEDALKPYAEERGLNARDISVPNGSALLFDSVALDRSANADKVAVEFARLPTTSPDIFSSSRFGSASNIDGLTLAVSSHSKAVLDELTQYDSTLIADKDHPNLQQYMQNGSELGTLFKLTLFNPDSTYSSMLEGKVTDYANSLSATINQPGADGKPAPGGDAVGRMAMLQAGLTDGVRQGYDQLAKDEAKQKEVMGFILDVALSALPAGKWASDSVEKVITDTFGNSPKLQEILKGVSGTLIDSATGKLTDTAKEKILETLGKDEGSLEIAKNAANKLNESFMNQIDPGDYDRNQIQTTYNQILNGIELARK